MRVARRLARGDVRRLVIETSESVLILNPSDEGGGRR